MSAVLQSISYAEKSVSAGFPEATFFSVHEVRPWLGPEFMTVTC